MKVKMSTLITVAALLMILIVAMIIVVARADAGNTTSAWVICKPGGLVHVRSKPGGSVQGSVLPGREVHTDGKTRNGYLHILDMTEDGEGWVHLGYVVDEPPIIEKCNGTIAATGRVMSWRRIDSGKNGWLNICDQVRIYARTEEWAVTSRGYIKADWLEVSIE